MKLSVRSLFLIDAIGAVISALCLGVILPMFQPLFGISILTLYSLALVACVLFIYSSFNYFFPQRKQNVFLKGIAVANLCYALLTATMMAYSYQDLTWLAYFYFLTEIVLIIILVKVEWTIAKTKL